MAFLSPKLFDCCFHNAVEGIQLHQLYGLMYCTSRFGGIETCDIIERNRSQIAEK